MMHIMENNAAILIADLSGYTALTEAHGASTAAITIDKYINIVHSSLRGKTILHERIGDEVMILSDSADDLIDTAIMLIHNCSKENYFLQIHGGLHYGKILKHNRHYFGSPINHTSRIAGKANNGTFWCSSSFINALSNPSKYLFSSKGKHHFKNVTEKIDVFEITLNKLLACHIDPVCRMLIIDKEKAVPHPRDKNVFFCSPHCLNISVMDSNNRKHLNA